MKKHNYLKKALSLAMMLVMLVSLASIGVSADGLGFDLEFPIWEIFLNTESEDFLGTSNMTWVTNDYSVDMVISSDDYEQYIQPFEGDYRDITLELAGMKLAGDNGDYTENLTDELVIEAMPEFPADNASYEDWMAWEEAYNAWTDTFFDVYGYEYDEMTGTFWELIMPRSVIVTYVNHRHSLAGSQMYFDDNHHWQLCAECANRVYLSNHSDKDADGKCDFCGNAIKYYNVTVKDTTGGKVTLSANKAAMNGKISVTVTPDAGYHLEALNFVNANAAHSKRAVWEDTPNAEYHFFVANWDVEVEAIFVKD